MIEYGVRFQDGSVAHPFNGRTARQRCEEMLQKLRMEFPENPACRFSYAVVQRTSEGPWGATE